MAELIPYKKENVVLRLREGSLAEKWYAGFLGYQKVSLPDRDTEEAPLIAEPLVSQDHRKFKTTSDKSDLITIRQGIENEDGGAGDAGEPQGVQPQGAILSSMSIQALRKEAKALGIKTTGLDEKQLIEEIEYAQQNPQQDDYQ